MSYPGQTPMGIPGMPPMPYMVGAPPPILGGVMPMPHMVPTPVTAMQTSAPAVRYQRNQPAPPPPRPEVPRPKRERETGPPVTVFVGNIMDRAPDIMVRHILGACGHVLSWKRVQAFGFCEYAGPDAGLRAIRILHDMEIGNKKLVVKVDAKTKVELDKFKAERRKKLKGGSSPLQDETPAETNESEDNDDYLDETMKAIDAEALQRIQQILSEHLTDLEIIANNSEEPIKTTVAKILTLDDAEIEESKRDLITREIGKFREVMKKQEEEKAKVKKKREKEENEEREKREKERKDRNKDDDNNSTKLDGDDADPGSPHKGRSGSTGSSRRDKRRSRSRSKDRDRERERGRSERERERDSESRHRERDGERHRDRDRDRDRAERERNDRAERERERNDRAERERERNDRERERERERDRERERERELRERERDRDREREREEARKTEREIMREREEEEEAKERKKNERRAREKDMVYQEKLRNWEVRERRKQKEYDKENDKKRSKRESREREAKRLKEFLEDYDDDRDDAKYYKGKELARRLEERAVEAEADSRDRCAERQELQRLKEKLYADSNYADPAAEFERLKAEREEQYKPKPVITIIDEDDDKPPSRHKEKERQEMPPIETEPIDSDSDEAAHYDNGSSQPVQEISRTPPRPHPHHHHHRRHHRHHQNHHRGEPIEEHEVEQIDLERDGPIKDKRTLSPPIRSTTPPQPPQPPSHDEDSRTSLASEPDKVSGSNFVPFAMGGGGSRGDHGMGNKTPASPNAISGSNQSRKKNRIDVKDVFNNDDDDDSTNNAKKRKLVPIDYGEEKKKKNEEAAAAKNLKEENSKSQEEKRKHIKSLIDKIPTDKNALFGYQLDWAVIDNSLMEKRIRPWINKKIIEYIGEPEPTLVDFICSKVMAGSSPQGILDDVQMVLDEEAEVFVVKMWRLLIYEVEAKKMGLVK